ncbi:unnamed protein product [Meloidogyne enterolobii]|uniref:Uncharacterized protein n=1 Tax=Meloidogyne enterolobii TaxID=390850 RepID=A0ACB1B1D9_MELEN
MPFANFLSTSRVFSSLLYLNFCPLNNFIFNIVFLLFLSFPFLTDSFYLASRLEEREADQKMEYDKLHERYNELLRTHIDHVERTKFLMGTEMFDMANSLPVASKNNKFVFFSFDY